MKIIYSCIVIIIIILLLPIKDNSHTYQIFRNNRSDTLIIKGISFTTNTSEHTVYIKQTNAEVLVDSVNEIKILMIDKSKVITFLNTKGCSKEFATELIEFIINKSNTKVNKKDLLSFIISQPQFFNIALQVSAEKILDYIDIYTLTDKNNNIILYY